MGAVKIVEGMHAGCTYGSHKVEMQRWQPQNHLLEMVYEVSSACAASVTLFETDSGRNCPRRELLVTTRKTCLNHLHTVLQYEPTHAPPHPSRPRHINEPQNQPGKRSVG